MASVPGEVLAFLDQQKVRHGRVIEQPKVEKVLSFLGTTSAAGEHLELLPFRLRGFELSAGGKELSVRLAGRLPSAPEKGDCITVSATNYARMKGYQIRTYDLHITDLVHLLYESRSDEVVVHGRLIYTVHNSPNSLKVFEDIPIDEVRENLGGVKYALVGVGQRANISPRFIFHYEERNGTLHLFHGEGFPHKTFLNLQGNPFERQLILDLDSFTGYSLAGSAQAVTEADEPAIFSKVVEGFVSRGWGPPKRVYSLAVSSWSRVAP